MRDPEFTDTVRRYSAYMRYRAEFRARDSSIDVDDILQEAWIRAWKSWDFVGGLERPGGILRRIVDQAASQLWRSAIASKRQHEQVPLHECTDEEHPMICDQQESAVMLRDTVAILAAMPGWCGDAIGQHAMGYLMEDIAEERGVSHQAVQQQISRGRRLLKMGA